MFLNYFLLGDQRNIFHQIHHCNLLFLQLKEITCNFLEPSYVRTIKRKGYLLLENFYKLKNLNLF